MEVCIQSHLSFFFSLHAIFPFSARSVTLNGTTYKKSQVLLHDVLEDEPQFSEILQIYEAPTKTIFIMRDLITVSFSQHYHAYTVSPTTNITVRTYDQFIDYHPLHISKVHGSWFIVLKYHVHKQ